MNFENGFILKICGLRTPRMADAAVEAGADAVGLVFAPRSPRCVTLAEAREVIGTLPGSVEPVGLWVDPDDDSESLRRTAEELGLRTLQLHGRCEEVLESLEDFSVWRAVSFEAAGAAESLKRADRWAARWPQVQAVLFDAHDPAGIGGGTGRSFDWAALREAIDQVQPLIPLMLAGGLTPENVADAVARVRPAGVDVSSGVESERGVKDAEKIRRFCLAARQAAARWKR